MKRLAALLLAAALAALAPAGAQEADKEAKARARALQAGMTGELLENTDFAQWDGSRPAGWSIWNPIKGCKAVPGPPGPSGAPSLELVPDDAGFIDLNARVPAARSTTAWVATSCLTIRHTARISSHMVRLNEFSRSGRLKVQISTAPSRRVWIRLMASSVFPGFAPRRRERQGGIEKPRPFRPERDVGLLRHGARVDVGPQRDLLSRPPRIDVGYDACGEFAPADTEVRISHFGEKRDDLLRRLEFLVPEFRAPVKLVPPRRKKLFHAFRLLSQNILHIDHSLIRIVYPL